MKAKDFEHNKIYYFVIDGISSTKIYEMKCKITKQNIIFIDKKTDEEFFFSVSNYDKDYDYIFEKYEDAKFEWFKRLNKSMIEDYGITLEEIYNDLHNFKIKYPEYFI